MTFADLTVPTPPDMGKGSEPPSLWDTRPRLGFFCPLSPLPPGKVTDLKLWRSPLGASP